jgi:hypothetical protein
VLDETRRRNVLVSVAPAEISLISRRTHCTTAAGMSSD